MFNIFSKKRDKPPPQSTSMVEATRVQGVVTSG